MVVIDEQQAPTRHAAIRGRQGSDLLNAFKTRGQVDVERRAPPWLADHPDGAAMPRQDALRHGEPQTRATPNRFGGEKRVEDAGEVFRRDARPLITHRQRDITARRQSLGFGHQSDTWRGRQFDDINRHQNLALPVHGVGRVGHQVDQHLLQLRGVGFHPGLLAPALHHQFAMLGHRRRQQAERWLDQVTD